MTFFFFQSTFLIYLCLPIALAKTSGTMLTRGSDLLLLSKGKLFFFFFFGFFFFLGPPLRHMEVPGLGVEL